MPQLLIPILSKNLNISQKQVANTLTLFADGATIPFIARYRQELTGGLDEVQIESIEKENTRLLDLEKRRALILENIEEQGALTDELKSKINNTWSLTELEDLYLPYKPKRKTKASVARENGLEPLAGVIMKQDSGNIESFARRFVKGNVKTVEEALEGAGHIMAEWVSERQAARESMRRLFRRKASITAKVIKGKEEEAEKYRDYFDYSEPLSRIPSHRLLAVRRAETEGFLRVSISPPEEDALKDLERIFVRGKNEASHQVEIAVKDAYKRLLKPSIETEFKTESKAKADDQAISVFAENLRQLLLTPPIGQKRTLGIDPGFKSGCKTVCLDEHGQLLHNETIYPHPPQRSEERRVGKECRSGWVEDQ